MDTYAHTTATESKCVISLDHVVEVLVYSIGDDWRQLFSTMKLVQAVEALRFQARVVSDLYLCRLRHARFRAACS